MKTYQESHIITQNELCYDNSIKKAGDSMNNKLVGKFIAQTRRKRKLTQAQLGEMLGISDKAISKWERGLSAPDITILPKLSEALGVSIAEILLGAEINTPITKEKASDITVSGIGFYKKIFRRKYTKIIGILIGIILMIVIGFSTLYMFANYNKVQVYELESNNEDIFLEGIIVKNQKENSLMIGNFVFIDRNSESHSQKYIIRKANIILKIDNTIIINNHEEYNDKTIYDILKSTNIFINESSVINNYAMKGLEKSDISINFELININDEVISIQIPLEVTERFSNNKLVY